MGAICARKQGDKTYYIYQESYRVKINREDIGKQRGSGKSKVVTRSVYLGTAEKILSAVREKKEPLSVDVRQFGLVAGAYQTAREIGLKDILIKHIPGNRGGVPRWIYFLTSIINRLDQATSKNRMSQWLAGTILPQLLGIDPFDLSGKNFWYAADDVLSEKELKKRRKEQEGSDGPLLAGLDDAFTRMEMELFSHIDQMMGLSPSLVFYDTTNFFTYIQKPARSALANTCHSKDSKNHLNHVGLLMAVEKSHKIPLLSQVYQANRHDSKVFSCILNDFQLLKDQAIIRFRPMRHWTDTKIRAYAFCCVVALTIMRVMQWKARSAGYTLSPHVLKDELSDIKEVVIAYSTTNVRMKITDRSTVQNKLWEVLNLGEVEQLLSLH